MDASHGLYASTSDVQQRFGAEKINATRKMFLEELKELPSEKRLEPGRDIAWVFDVGCSLGYLLRHVETGLFTGAERMAGIDIDEQAVHDGQRHLEALKSKVRMRTADTEDLPRVLGSDHSTCSSARAC